MLVDTLRHEDHFASKKWNTPVELIGTGGVGSFVADMLVRLGVGSQSPLRFYDNDRVERHNISNQNYEPSDINEKKAIALFQRYSVWGPNHQLSAHDEHATGATELSGLVFLCLDSMVSRKELVLSCANNKKVVGIIETRMDANTVISHAFNPHDELQLGAWLETWFPDELAENSMGCNGHTSIVDTVNVTAGFAVRQFVRFARQGSMHGIPNKVVFDMETLQTTRVVYWGT